MGDIELQAALSIFGAGGVGGLVAWLCHPLVPEEIRKDLKEHSSLVSGVIGTIFAVTIGLMIVSANSELASAQKNVEFEARAVQDLAWYAQTLPDSDRSKIDSLTRQYVDTVIEVEWPQMTSEAKLSAKGWEILDSLRIYMMSEITPTAGSGAIQYSQAMARLEDVFDARRIRQSDVEYSIPTILWWGIALSGLLVISFPVTIGGSARIVHSVIATVATIAVSCLLLLVILLNHPFQGIRVSSTAFEEARTTLPSISSLFPGSVKFSLLRGMG